MYFHPEAKKMFQTFFPISQLDQKVVPKGVVFELLKDE